MGYLIKAGLGAALFLGGIVLFNVKLLDMLDIGTCASGNTPYQISRPCPEGTGTSMMLMMAGIFAGLIGALIFAFRGEAPWGSGKKRFGTFFGLGAFAWGLFFTATGTTCLVSALTDDSLSAGSDLGAKIVAGTFLFMGIPVLLISLWGFVKSFGSGGDERPASASAGAGAGPMGGVFGRMKAGLEQAQSAQTLGQKMPWGSSGTGTAGTAAKKGSGDTIGKIERLQKLKESGAITDSEFQREKTKILAEQ